MDNIDGLVTRQAVSEWRDRFILSAWNVVNGAGQGAREAFSRHLDEAGILDSIWDPAGFTYERVDALMRATLAGAIEGIFRSAAAELTAIDPAFATLAGALAQSAQNVVLPMLEAPAVVTEPAAPTPPTPAEAGMLSRLSSYVADSSLSKGALEWASWAAEAVGQAGDAASRVVQSKTGLHDRLHKAALERVASAWMGSQGDPRPVMAQVIALADEVNNGARSMAL